MRRPSQTVRRIGAALTVVVVAFGPLARPAAADAYVPVSGNGSSWSYNAIAQWAADVDQNGIRVNYTATGSSDGRSQFLKGTEDFGASDIPFQSHPEDGSPPEQPIAGSYAYMPITAGGTVFMYNLKINGQRVTNLRLSGQNITKIYTGVITSWNDPALAADNPGLALPNRPVVPVVRSDGSGSTAQFSLWMISQFNDLWKAYCQKVGRAQACGETSYYPASGNMVAQNGDLGVAGYVAQDYAEGAIGYVNYSYALNAHFPVAKMLNSAGYYTEPTAQNVAVSLLKAEVDTTDTDPSLYLTQKLNGVYNDTDPRTYPLSSYSYLILPMTVGGQFNKNKGKTLAAFAYYAMCQGQQGAGDLGYSPMPVNLVEASFEQIKHIPGAVVENIDIKTCNNPTFSPSSPNLLADTAPQPQDCDKQGSTQCGSGTGGAATPTPQSSNTPGAIVVDNSGGGNPSSGGGGNPSSSGGGTPTSSGGGNPTSSGGGNPTSSGAGTGTGGTPTANGGTSGNGSNGSRSGNGAGSTSGRSSTATTRPCDPSSGNCTASSRVASSRSQGTGTSNGSGNGSSDASLASASPTTLPASRGWGSTQTLMVLVLLLVGGLVVAPGFVARHLDRRRDL